MYYTVYLIVASAFLGQYGIPANASAAITIGFKTQGACQEWVRNNASQVERNGLTIVFPVCEKVDPQ